jgi:hypothetical protein
MVMAQADVETAVIAEGDRVRIRRSSRLFAMVPGFVFILADYLVC